MLQAIVDSRYDDDMNRKLILRDNKKKRLGRNGMSRRGLLDHLKNMIMQGRFSFLNTLDYRMPLTKYVNMYYKLTYRNTFDYSEEVVENMVGEIMMCLGWPARKWKLHRSEDLTLLFCECTHFNEDIGDWDVSGVTSMEHMFVFCCKFNQDLSRWNTGSVRNMSGMFHGAPSFNSPLFQNVGNVEDFDRLFYGCIDFNQDISAWNTSMVVNMSSMFYHARSFNSEIGGWNTEAVTDMRAMFKGAISFGRDISNWDVSCVEDMGHMFEGATSFNCDLNRWDVSARLEHVEYMFKDATSFNGKFYNSDENYDGENMFELVGARFCQSMFEGCTNFNQEIRGEFSMVEDMSRMFYNATSFNQDIECQSVNCTSFSKMFYNATSFNGKFSVDRDTFDNKEADLSYMFFNAKSFNQDISDWKVSPYNSMVNMFNGASSFNQDLNNWNFFGLGPESDYHLNGIFVNCTSLDVEMTDWFEKFISESEDLDIYQYFAGSEKMLALFFAWKEVNESSDRYA